MKIRRTFAEVGESDVPVEQVDLVEASRQGLADVDSVECVCTETSCSQIFESVASDSLLEDYYFQGSFVSTAESDGSKCTWFWNDHKDESFETELTAAEEPALLTSYEFKEDQSTQFADYFLEEIEIPKDMSEKNQEDTEDHLVEDIADKPLYAGSRLMLGISLLLIVTFAVRHALSGAALSDLLTLIEMHCVLPNFCANTSKLLRDFVKKLKSLIELHYYCCFCQEYFGPETPQHVQIQLV